MTYNKSSLIFLKTKNDPIIKQPNTFIESGHKSLTSMIQGVLLKKLIAIADKATKN